jgi:endoglucanase
MMPIIIPGKVEAENFNVNNGFEIETTSDTGGGSNIGYTNNGDYLDYIVDVTKLGFYQVDYRVSSESAGGALSLKTVGANGVTNNISEVSFNATGGWQTWKTVQDTMAYLDKGLNTIRLQATASDFNVNWFKMTFLSEGPPTSIDDPIVDTTINLYPNPNSGEFTLEFRPDYQPNKITILNLSGKKLLELIPPKDSNQMVLKPELPAGLYVVVVENHKELHCKKLIIQ